MAPAGSGDEPPVRSIMFSDSILSYVEAQSRRGMVSLIRETGKLIGTAMANGLMLRGAIVKGELFISEDKSVFLGKSIVRAYNLEQGQKAAGAIVDPITVFDDEEGWRGVQGAMLRGLVRKLHVPWKSNPSPRPHHVVDWTKGTHGVSDETLRRRFRDVMGDPDDDAWAIQDATLTLREELVKRRPPQEESTGDKTNAE